MKSNQQTAEPLEQLQFFQHIGESGQKEERRGKLKKYFASTTLFMVLKAAVACKSGHPSTALTHIDAWWIELKENENLAEMMKTETNYLGAKSLRDALKNQIKENPREFCQQYQMFLDAVSDDEEKVLYQ